jgi:hypothetical protein
MWRRGAKIFLPFARTDLVAIFLGGAANSVARVKTVSTIGGAWMASIVDRYGVQVDVEVPLEMDGDLRELIRDSIMCKLLRRGLSRAAVGKILNAGETTVRRRLKAMGPQRQAYYEQLDLSRA